MNNKIGIGIVTYNREDYFKQVIASIPDNVGDIVVINDGSPYPQSTYPKHVKEVIQHSSNKCVGISKNEALRWMMQNGCEHFFLIEDDMKMLRADVFETYIRAAEASGIWHMNYGPGSPFNRVQDPRIPIDLETRHLLSETSDPNPRLIVEVAKDIKIALYRHTVAMFSYFLRGVIKHVGYMDEHYKNAWEHCCHTYRIAKAGLHPPFWWFADIWDSTQYMQELKGAITNSSIAKDKETWRKNINEGAAWYQHIHGHYPAQAPDTPQEEVIRQLREIKAKYARPPH